MTSRQRLIIERFRSIYQISNLFHASMAVLRYLLRPVISWGKMIVFEKVITQTIDKETRPITFCDIDKNNIEELRKYSIEKLSSDYLKKRISMGDIFNIMIDDNSGAIVGYGFMNLDYMGISGIEVKLAPEMMYSHDSFIMPDHRGRGLHACLLNHKTSIGYENGRKRCLLDILHYNRSSIRGVSKANFEKIGCLRSYTLWGVWKIICCKSSLLNYIQGTQTH